MLYVVLEQARTGRKEAGGSEHEDQSSSVVGTSDQSDLSATVADSMSSSGYDAMTSSAYNNGFRLWANTESVTDKDDPLNPEEITNTALEVMSNWGGTESLTSNEYENLQHFLRENPDIAQTINKNTGELRVSPSRKYSSEYHFQKTARIIWSKQKRKKANEQLLVHNKERMLIYCNEKWIYLPPHEGYNKRRIDIMNTCSLPVPENLKPVILQNERLLEAFSNVRQSDVNVIYEEHKGSSDIRCCIAIDYPCKNSVHYRFKELGDSWELENETPPCAGGPRAYPYSCEGETALRIIEDNYEKTELLEELEETGLGLLDSTEYYESLRHFLSENPNIAQTINRKTSKFAFDYRKPALITWSSKNTGEQILIYCSKQWVHIPAGKRHNQRRQHIMAICTLGFPESLNPSFAS